MLSGFISVCYKVVCTIFDISLLCMLLAFVPFAGLWRYFVRVTITRSYNSNITKEKHFWIQRPVIVRLTLWYWIWQWQCTLKYIYLYPQVPEINNHIKMEVCVRCGSGQIVASNFLTLSRRGSGGHWGLFAHRVRVQQEQVCGPCPFMRRLALQFLLWEHHFMPNNFRLFFVCSNRAAFTPWLRYHLNDIVIGKIFFLLVKNNRRSWRGVGSAKLRSATKGPKISLPWPRIHPHTCLTLRDCRRYASKSNTWSWRSSSASRRGKWNGLLDLANTYQCLDRCSPYHLRRTVCMPCTKVWEQRHHREWDHEQVRNHGWRPCQRFDVPPHIDTISPACRCVLFSLSVVSVLVGTALSLRILSAHSYWLKAKASCDVINRRRVYPGPSLPLQFPTCPNPTRRVQQVQCPVGGAWILALGPPEDLFVSLAFPSQ